MGAVYEAEHVGLGKLVALKLIDPEFATDERIVSRFAREARVLSSVESAHIVTVFDAGTEDGRPYLVMELLRGEDLGEWLRRAHRVPLPDAMHVVAQVLKGLARAHAAGIVHRDLKPDNVFLVKSDTDPLFAKIVDFGVSKIERPKNRTAPLALTGRGTVLGTPFYMCPEQARALPDVDGRADLYSVGAILFECLTGRPPHTGETYEQVILSICMADAPDPRAIDPRIPANVASFLARALARDRVHRFASAERMLAALHEIAPDEKKRVPLDVAPETLVSPGALPVATEVPLSSAHVRAADVAERDHAAAETRLVGSLSGPAANVPADGSGVAHAPIVNRARADKPPARSATPIPELPPQRRTRATTAMIATAFLATLTGIGVTLGIIVVLGKKPEASPPAVSSLVVASASTPVVSVSATTTPAPSTPARSSSTSTRPSPPVRAGGGAKHEPKKLDISRELP
jgi:serine/threonine-protein kinase